MMYRCLNIITKAEELADREYRPVLQEKIDEADREREAAAAARQAAENERRRYEDLLQNLEQEIRDRAGAMYQKMAEKLEQAKKQYEKLTEELEKKIRNAADLIREKVREVVSDLRADRNSGKREQHLEESGADTHPGYPHAAFEIPQALFYFTNIL